MPAPEAAVLIHGAKPLARRLTLNFVLLVFFAFSLNDENLVIGETGKEVWPVLVFAAVKDVADFKPEVVVLHPGGDVRASVEVESGSAFPSAVADAEIDVRFSRVDVRLACIPRPRVAGRDDRLIGINDQFV